jgi:homoserine kinase
MSIKVRAPASTANLGPGFDCLAAALSVSLEIEATESDEGSFTFEGRDPNPGPLGEELILRGVTAMAGEAPHLDLTVRSDIPMGAGMGSSAAAVAAGLLIGCALTDREPDRGDLLQLGASIEGHPDNLAAVLYGGLALVVPVAGGLDVLTFVPTASVRPLILLPRERLATSEARRALPDDVSLSDAISNSARMAGLVALLSGVVSPESDRLWTYTHDLFHQPYRAPLMPHTAAALERLRGEGVPAALSGAGPSIVCLVVRGEEEGTKKTVEGIEGWELLELDWDTDGARIVSS